MNRPRALVIGGSLSGLFAANLLRTIGWHVEVFERARGDLTGRGAGLGAQTDLFAVMRRIGIQIDRSMWTEVRSHICLDQSGKMICEVPVREVTTAWGRVYRALRQAFPTEHYHGGMTLAGCKQEERRVVAVFVNGMLAEADLLIGADGMRSTLRRQFMPEIAPHYVGYVAWRGVVEESQIQPLWRASTLHDMVFCLPEGELAFSIPMAANDDAGRDRRCMFVWFRPVEYGSNLRQLCTDATGLCHGDSIPPPLIRKEVVTELKLAARTLLAPQLSELVAYAGEPILSAIFDLEAPRMTFGRVALVGDAAFVARPHVGTGVTKAAQDAQALTDALAGAEGDLAAALQSYERNRTNAGKELVARGRRLGGHLEPPQSGGDRDGERARRPPIKTLLREYGPGSIANWPLEV
jgi:2-polyprenyl-6-methoxyphenol hydroxylase-like FAD-dependent oxidoreductase